MRNASKSDAKLSVSQKRLLQQLIARKISDDGADSGFTRVPPGSPVPLCSAQARIWFMERIYPDSSLYNACNTLYLAQWPDEAALKAALRVLMDRHDVLRLRIFESNGEPFQEGSTTLDVPLTWHDVRAATAEEAQGRADKIAERTARAPFQLDRAPLFRISAILLPNGKTLLVCVFHHIIMDGWSVGLFYEEITALLVGQRLKPAPSIQFLDYVAWQRANGDDSRLASTLAYWRKKLGGELPILDIPKDRPRQTSSLSFEGYLIAFSISPDVIKRLKDLADSEQTTLFVVLLAAYKVLLLRLTGQTDLIIGAPFAGRDHPMAEPLFGCFANMVALRTNLDGNPSYREVVQRVRATTLEAYDNQSVPFDQVVKELKLPRDLQYSPIFQVQFALDNVSNIFGLVGSEVGESEVETGTSKFDLTLSVIETTTGATGYMEYAATLFDKSTVQRYVDMYVRLLEALVNQPDAPVRRIGLLSTPEKEHILFGLNTYARPEHRYRTMAEPFEEQVARTPDAIALVGDEGRLTYAALNEQANQLAHFLRESGVERGSFVAVCMERSFALIVALYGIAKSGAAYVPLDPELPKARITFMLEDTTPSIVLVDRVSMAKATQGPWPVVSMDDDRDRWAELPTDNIPWEGPTHHLVHLLYTSGSTGRPKAVAYPINGAIAEIFWLHRFYPLQTGDANVFKTSYGFDVSIWEIFWTLYFGAQLVISRPGGHRDPSYLVEVIERHHVTTIFLIPSLLQVFLDEMPAGSCRSLHWVFCGGEPITPRLRDACHARLPARLINCYGPTEAGCVTDMILPPDSGSPTVPLGRPAENFRIYVLDEEREVTPIGVPGEVYLAGDVGLAQCYYARPDLTAERFLPDPFGSPGARMYRTGDICRYREDGVLEHLGRSGRQVKVRGIRIELAEIETVLCEHERVETCVVLAIEHDIGQRILAFVVPQNDEPIDPRELAEYADRFLPQWMIPSSIVSIREIPTTLNGKLDREALIERWREAGTTVARDVVAPSNTREERLKRIFKQVLGCEVISVTESFFDLGGHSLLVFKLISACVQEFGWRPSVADIFSSSSVRELSARMNALNTLSHASLAPLAPKPGKPLIVFVHAASGSVAPFFEVARHLSDDYSVFGLQALDIDDDHGLIASIETLATAYVEAVDAIRGLSPIIIAGWSMGGCVGLEMARQWRQQGVDVAALLMLDSWVPPGALDSAEARAEARRSIQEIDFLRLQDHELSQLGESSDIIARLERVLNANRFAFLDYEPIWFDGEIDYLRAVEPFPNTTRKLPDTYSLADRGWGSHVHHVAVHDIAGNHFTLATKENAAALADTIRSIAEARLSFSVV